MKLTTKARNAIPAKNFAGPGRSYPIEDAIPGQRAGSCREQVAGPEGSRPGQGAHEVSLHRHES